MPNHIIQWEADLAIARQIAEGAGEIIKSYWGQDFSVEHKGVVDLVSEVDLAAEAYLLQQLAQRRPKDLIMAEESAHDPDYIQKHLQTDATRTWCIDPLDGTTNFSHGFPHFCVSNLQPNAFSSLLFRSQSVDPSIMVRYGRIVGDAPRLSLTRA